MSLRKTQKKWSSFTEMKDDLLKEGVLKLEEKSLKDNISDPDSFLISSVLQIVKDTKNSSSSKDFFDCLCRFSALAEKVEERTLTKLLKTSNAYVLLLSAVFTNQTFSEKLVSTVKQERGTKKNWDETNIEDKKLINVAISLAFFPVVLTISDIQDESVEFLRRHITKLLRLHLKAANDPVISFANICFKIESITCNYKYHFTDRLPITLDQEFLFKRLKAARSLSGISYLALTINAVLGEQFTNAIKAMGDDSKRFSISKALENIYGAIIRIEKGIQSYYENTPPIFLPFLKDFFNIYIRDNERQLTFFTKEIASGFHYQKEKRFYEIILDKIEDADNIKKRISIFGKENLSAFTGELDLVKHEWSNKLFIISIECIAVLAEIGNAKDDHWKVSAAVRVLRQWVSNAHEIINFHFLEDEFASIIPFLEKEDARIEWKSSFLTPLEQEFINEKAELANSKSIFKRIVKTIIGMLNTEGGTIIVGFVEHPDRISRSDLMEHIIEKNGKSFFNVGYELSQKGKNIDQIRLQILDNLRSITQVSEEKFNDLFSIEPILLRVPKKTITIIKISVQKSEKPIFNIQEDKGTIWVSLTKRAEGKTIDVDVRDYI